MPNCCPNRVCVSIFLSWVPFYYSCIVCSVSNLNPLSLSRAQRVVSFPWVSHWYLHPIEYVFHLIVSICLLTKVLFHCLQESVELSFALLSAYSASLSSCQYKDNQSFLLGHTLIPDPLVHPVTSKSRIFAVMTAVEELGKTGHQLIVFSPFKGI